MTDGDRFLLVYVYDISGRTTKKYSGITTVVASSEAHLITAT